MQSFYARNLIGVSAVDLINMLPPKLEIIFEDGVALSTTNRKIIYSSYFWLMHGNYPNTPITSNHFVESVLKGKPLESNTHIKLLGQIFKDVAEVYQLNTPESKEHLLELVYIITNNINNEVSKIAESYVTSIDILDFIEVAEFPSIKQIIDNTLPNQESIAKTYATVNDIINTDPDLYNNALVRAIKTKMVNSNQVAQCVVVRGFLTEVDGSILRTPVLSNFTRGMGTLYNFIAESRSAAKSYYFSESPLQDAEYFARRLQLLCMTVEKIHYSDCGSDQYMHWRIAPPTVNDKGVKVYQGDLVFMIGKYYYDPESGGLKQITHDDPLLYNKVLKIRSVLFCKHKDSHSVCEVCFGALAKNVSRFANIGHLCCATMTQQTSQSVLSTKHLDASSVSTNITLTEVTSRYLTTNKAKNAYILRKDLKDKRPMITISRDEAMGLTDILSIDDVANINPVRVSSIDCIDISTIVDKEEMTMNIFVSQDNRYAVLTSEFLTYLKEHRWKTDPRNNFVFDLIGWDYSLPIMKLPDMEYSFSDHSHQIATIIESNMKNIADRLKPHSPVSTLQELFNLVNTKLNVNLAALEVIVYASMTTAKNHYDLARNHHSPVLGIADFIIKNRSLGAAYAYEDQLGTITSPRSFFKLGRPDSVFDVFIAPFEVIQEEKAKGIH